MNGRPPEHLNIHHRICVVDIIPEDGKCIRFGELKKQCNKHGISYRILRQELKRLEEAGTIVKEAVKAERGAGTCYRRNLSLHAPELPGFTRIFSDLLGQLKAAVEDVSTDEEKAVMASQGLLSALWVLQLTIYDELALYTTNPDREQAEKRLDSILSDFILPMIKRTTELARLPGACDTKAALAMDKLFVDNQKHWLDVWRSIEVPEDMLDIEEAKRKIAEIKKKAGIRD